MSGKVGGAAGHNKASLAGIPPASRKMVQSLKEIVSNIPDNEIYATLKDCNMDPNEAVSRLLSQGTENSRTRVFQFQHYEFNFFIPFCNLVFANRFCRSFSRGQEQTREEERGIIIYLLFFLKFNYVFNLCVIYVFDMFLWLF